MGPHCFSFLCEWCWCYVGAHFVHLCGLLCARTVPVHLLGMLSLANK